MDIIINCTKNCYKLEILKNIKIKYKNKISETNLEEHINYARNKDIFEL